MYIKSPAINPSDGPVLFSAGRLSKILVPEANLRLSVNLLILKNPVKSETIVPLILKSNLLNN